MKVSILQSLLGKQINKVIAGGSNGSIIILDIGNDEFSLFIYCSWRISKENEVLSSSTENNDSKTGNLTIEAKKIQGEEIVSIITTDLFDLQLVFKSGKVLSVFADITTNGYDSDAMDENWSLADKRNNIAYTISNTFKVITTSYY